MSPSKEVSKLISELIELIYKYNVSPEDKADIFTRILFVSALSYENGGLDAAKEMIKSAQHICGEKENNVN